MERAATAPALGAVGALALGHRRRRIRAAAAAAAAGADTALRHTRRRRHAPPTTQRSRRDEVARAAARHAIVLRTIAPPASRASAGRSRALRPSSAQRSRRRTDRGS